LTFLPLEEIDKMDKWEGSQLNTAKEILAYELTKLVHGEEEAVKAQNAAKALFGGGSVSDDMPSTELSDEDFNDGSIGLFKILTITKLAQSGRDARTLITQGSVTVNDKKITDSFASFTYDAIKENPLIIKKGKKVFHKVTVR
ncbi:MAG: tyrosine--tRNA ligase, partial [Clostridia bacterium]|nr:tyrosine--tRNA ligase [Clostridia bacterium]